MNAVVPTWVADLDVSATTAAAAATHDQRGDEWARVRRNRLTSSVFGIAAGYKGRAAQRDLVRRMLWGDEDRDASSYAARMMAYGTEMEPVARDAYVAVRAAAGDGFEVTETGFAICTEPGWGFLGASPDFFLAEAAPGCVADAGDATSPHHAFCAKVVSIPVPEPEPEQAAPAPPPPPPYTSLGCGEIKCPAASYEFYSSQAQHAKYGIPDVYYAQIQGAMAITGRTFCDFVVYTPVAMQVTRFPFNATYWSDELRPALRAFYMDEFVPRAVLRDAGAIPHGAVDPATPGLPHAPKPFAAIRRRGKAAAAAVTDPDDDALSVVSIVTFRGKK
jgi:hypothetical protein